MQLSAQQIDELFGALNDELSKHEVRGELYLVGGAVMCLVYKTRPSTRDVDALFEPAKTIRSAAKRVAAAFDLDENWLNDGVKGFLSEQAQFSPYLELSHLRVLTAQPEYLLAMKCLATRIGEGFHDIEDIRFLLRYLNIERYTTALEIIERYYPLSRFPQKALYLLQELLHA